MREPSVGPCVFPSCSCLNRSRTEAKKDLSSSWASTEVLERSCVISAVGDGGLGGARVVVPFWEHWVPLWSWLLGDNNGTEGVNPLICKCSAPLGFCLQKKTESLEIISTLVCCSSVKVSGCDLGRGRKLCSSLTFCSSSATKCSS